MAHRRTPSADLVDRIADWGVTVSESRKSRNGKAKLLLVLAYSLVFAAAILVLPMLVGSLLAFESDGIMSELTVILAIVLFGVVVKVRAGRLPRNAIQIDYRASEIRLGSERADGVFVRQRVAAFREIEDVRATADGSLAISLPGEDLTHRFNDADPASIERLAAQIAEARESALRAPIRSRIQSKIMGIEAGLREVRSRLTSRVA